MSGGGRRTTPRAGARRAATAPQAEPPPPQRPALLGLRLRRLGPGRYTLVAAAAALVVVLAALARSGHPAPVAPPPARRTATPALAPLCPESLAGAPAGPPAAYQHRVVATDPTRPGQQLVMATTGAQAAPGSSVAFYAVLTIPQATAASPGASAVSIETGSVPCLSVNGVAGAQLQPAPPGGPTATPSSTFTVRVPRGAAHGSTLRILATVPPNYPQQGQEPLDATLLIAIS